MSYKYSEQDLLNSLALGLGAAHAEDTPAGKRVKDAIDSDKWRPLENTDQALDVATVHKMTITIGEGAVCASYLDHVATDDTSKDMAAALRRAIVLVAAGAGEKQS